MDLFVFDSKQYSIAEPSGWPWRERGVYIYIYIHCVNLGLVFQAFQRMSHPFANQIYIYIYICIYICTFVVSLKIGKMMVVIDIYICVYLTCNMNMYIYIHISHRHNNVSKQSLNLGLVSISMHVLPIIHRPSNLCIYVHLLFPLRLGK